MSWTRCFVLSCLVIWQLTYSSHACILKNQYKNEDHQRI